MNSITPIFLAGLFWHLVVTVSLAQASQKFEFIKLRQEPDEFARLEVTNILQDRFGFMWFATTKGLIRYDGHELKPYREDPRDKTAIGSNFLKKIVEDEAGDLWVGSSEGYLFHYRQREETFINIPGARLSGAINDLLIDRRQRLWCATGGGLEYVDHGSQERQIFFDSTSLLYAAKVNSLY